MPEAEFNVTDYKSVPLIPDHHAGILAGQLDEISDQLKEDAGSRHGIAMMPQIPSGFGQNRGILFFAEDTLVVPAFSFQSIFPPDRPSTPRRYYVPCYVRYIGG